MKGKMLLLIGLLCSLNARADDLATQIESFIQGKFSGEPVQVKV
ncbi:TPA: flagellar basal body P-ring formation protein FlgA, partial [Serratia marcescens]|nr:flagellar basal body P-ring formation protein FlgA [Serratia marcescens]